MKKAVSIALILILLVSLGACAKKESAAPVIVAGDLTRPGQSEEAWNTQHTDAYADHTGLQIVYFDTLSSMLLALRSEHIDELYAPEPVAEYICARNDDLQYVKGRTTIHMSMAVREENTELLNSLGIALKELKDDGTIDALYEQYAAADKADPEPVTMQQTEGADTLRVIVTGDLPPLDYTTAEGAPAGFNAAFLSALGEKLGKNIELVSADAGSRASMLTSGRADAVFWMRAHETVTDGTPEPITSEAGVSVALTDAYLSLPLCRVSLK